MTIHSLANDWGHWVRKAEAKSVALQGTMGSDMWPGVPIRSYGQRIPILEFPEDVQAFHLGWLALEPALKSMIYIDYKLKISQKRKIKLARMGKNSYYKARKKALESIDNNWGDNQPLL